MNVLLFRGFQETKVARRSCRLFVAKKNDPRNVECCHSVVDDSPLNFNFYFPFSSRYVLSLLWVDAASDANFLAVLATEEAQPVIAFRSRKETELTPERSTVRCLQSTMRTGHMAAEVISGNVFIIDLESEAK